MLRPEHANGPRLVELGDVNDRHELPGARASSTATGRRAANPRAGAEDRPSGCRPACWLLRVVGHSARCGIVPCTDGLWRLSSGLPTTVPAEATATAKTSAMDRARRSTRRW